MAAGTRPDDAEAWTAALARAERDYARLTGGPEPVANGAAVALAALAVAQCATAVGDAEALRRGIDDAAIWAGAALAADETGLAVMVRSGDGGAGLAVAGGAGLLAPPDQLDGIAAAALARDPVALDGLCRPGTAEKGRQRALFRRAVVGGELFWPPLIAVIGGVTAGRPVLPTLVEGARLAQAGSDTGVLDRAALDATIVPLLDVADALSRGDEEAWGAASAAALAGFTRYFEGERVRMLPVSTLPLGLCGLAAVAHDRHGWAVPAEMPGILADLIGQRGVA